MHKATVSTLIAASIVLLLTSAAQAMADAQRALKNPNARRLEVEDAMFVTLKKNNIVLPDSFFTVNSSFKPKYPPKS